MKRSHSRNLLTLLVLLSLSFFTFGSISNPYPETSTQTAVKSELLSLSDATLQSNAEEVNNTLPSNFALYTIFGASVLSMVAKGWIRKKSSTKSTKVGTAGKATNPAAQPLQ